MHRILSAFLIFCAIPFLGLHGLQAQTCTKGNLNFAISAQRCVGQSITFTNNTPNQAGNVFEILVGTTKLAGTVYNISDPGELTITFRRVDANGACLNEYTEKITVAAPPQVNFTFDSNNSAPVCSGTPVKFTNASTPATGVTYLWEFGDGNTSTLKDPSHTFQAFGSTEQDYSVKLTVTLPGGCSANIIKVVKVKQRPNPQLKDEFGFAVVDLKNCDNVAAGNAIFKVKLTDATVVTGSRYELDWGDGSPKLTANAPIANAEHTYNTVGVYTIKYSITGPNGCVGTRNVLVYNISNPAIGVATNGSTTGCAPLTRDFIISNFEANDASTIYRINPGDGSPDQFFNHPPPAVFTHTYQASSCTPNGNSFEFSVFAQNGCATSRASVAPVRVYAGPKASISANAVVCVGQPVAFLNRTTLGADNNCSTQTSFTWDFGDGTPVRQTTGSTTPLPSVSHTYTAAGTYTVTLKTENRSCQGTDATFKITVIPPAISVFTGGTDQTIKSAPNNPPTPPELLVANDGCLPANLDLINQSLGLVDTTEWRVISGPRDGFLFGAGDTISYRNNERLTFSKPGTYLIQLRVANGCNDSTSVAKVEIKDKPIVAVADIGGFGGNSEFVLANGKQVACSPANLDLFTNLSGLSNNALINSYLWEIKGINGTANPTVPTGLASADPGAIQLPTGEYRVSLTVGNTCGTTTVSQDIQVVEPPTAQIDIDQAAICVAESVVLTANEGAGLTYQWKKDGTPIPGATARTLSVTQAGSYTVTVSQGRCSSESPATVVAIKPTPVVQITTTDRLAYCQGEAISTTLQASGGAGRTFQWLKDGQPVPNATNATLVATAAGSYIVEVVENGCPGVSAATAIIVNPLPTIAILPNNPQICIGGQISLQAQGGVSYTWSPADGLSAATGAQVTARPTATTTYTVTGTDANGCQNTAQVTVTVNPLPDVVLSISADTICLGETVNLSATGAGLFEWSPADGLSATNGATITASPAQTTVYTVKGISGAGCEDIETFQIVVKPLPVLTGADESACLFEPSFVLSVSAPANGAGEWSSATLPTGALLPDGTFDPQLAGVNFDGHEVVYTFKENGPDPQCENVLTKKVVVFPKPTPDFVIDSLLCVNSPISFTNRTADIPGETLRFEWRFPDGTTATTRDAVHTFTDTASFVRVGLFAFSGSGCVDSVFQTVSIVLPPAPKFSYTIAPTNGCGPLTVTFDNESVGRALSYQWDFGNGQTSTAAQPSPVVYPPSAFQDTVYRISLTVNNLCGTVTYRDSVLVRTSAQANFIFEFNEYCTNAPLRMFNSSIGQVDQFIWNFGDGSPLLTTADTGFVVHSFNHNGPSDTTFLVSLVAINDCQADTIVKPIRIVQSRVTAFFNADKIRGCAPLTVNFSSNQDGRNAIVWLWGDRVGNGVTGGINQSYTYADVGQFTAQLIVINGCHIDTFSRTIEVLPSPVASFEIPASICVGGTVAFQNTSPNPFGSRWDLGDGTSFNGATPPNKVYAVAGLYRISLTVTDPVNGCATTVTKELNVRPFPNAAFSLSSNDLCEAEPVTFQNTSTGAASYQWLVTLPSGVVESTVSESPSWLFSQPGLHRVQLVAYTDAGQTGCADSTFQTVNVLRKPQPLFSIAQSLDCESVTIAIDNLTEFPKPGEGRLSWDFGNGQILTNAFEVTQSPVFTNFTDQPITYTITLTAVTNQGCRQAYSQDLVVEPSLVCPVTFPNAFTPNGDGENDRFYPKFLEENVEEYHLMVFSRWGNMVYEYVKTANDAPLPADDPALPASEMPWQWDGTYEGKPSPHDTYTYRLAVRCCNGEKKVITGDVLLIR